MKSRFAIGMIALACGIWLATGRSSPAASTFPNDERTIVHALNRIGFGPRPGDVERVRRIGLERYIDQQLHPARIADAAMQSRLEGLKTTTLSSREIAEQYAMPALQARRERQQQMKADDGTEAPPRQQDPRDQRANQVLVELSEQKVLRAVYSERQLEEVLVDFWFNHFNVDARKGIDRFLVTEYERDAIRPHVLGSFRDLLEATAKSPAMLFYLDNWMSAAEAALASGQRQDLSRRSQMEGRRARRGRIGAPVVGRVRPPRVQQGNNAPKGLNENYSRELMELHALGVDGGYTQKDVTEVARAFTGWTIQQPRQGGSFRFDPRIHDAGEKIVLGHRIKGGGGIEDGEQVLDILAKHPSTARFIATKLVRRFVSDDAPGALIDRVAARFAGSDGDLREVVRTILTSPEFLAPGAYRAKVKTPFEFIVSAMRVTGADVADAMPLVRALQQLGMPLYQCQPPTGYQDTADAWVNTGALVGRMNFALRLAGNQVPGVAIATEQSIVETALNGDVAETTRATIAKATSSEQMTALTLGAPEFQRR